MTPWRGGGLVGLPRTCADLATVGYSWYYNWSRTPSCPGVPFVPMVKSGWSGALGFGLDGGSNQYLLTFNEPDAVGMTVERALALWPQLEATGRQLSSPAVTQTTRGSNWLKAFMAGARADGKRVDFIAAHWYGGSDPRSLVSYLNQLHAWYELPIWLTEFCCYNGSLAANTQFAQKVGPLLAGLPWLSRVGWFCNRSLAGGYQHTGLVDSSGALTSVGTAYKAWQKPVTKAAITKSLSEPCGRCGHEKAFHRYGMVDGQLKERTHCQHTGCACRDWRAEKESE